MAAYGVDATVGAEFEVKERVNVYVFAALRESVTVQLIEMEPTLVLLFGEVPETNTSLPCGATVSHDWAATVATEHDRVKVSPSASEKSE